MRVVVFLCLGCIMVMLASCGQLSITEKAQKVVEAMASGDYAAATKDFDGTMKSQLTPDQLGQVWNALVAQAGAFQGVAGTRIAEEQGYQVVYVTSRFERATVDVKVVFNGQNQIAGLFIVPSQPAG